MMREFILVLNTGSTSTKLALYQREKVVAEKTVSHSHEELAQYLFVTQQHDMRKRCVLDFLTEQQVQLEQLELIMSRGGSTLPVEGGAYLINDIMFDRLKNHPFVQHAGILGPVIARELANASGICAYVFDSAAVDEMTDVAHISGMKDSGIIISINSDPNAPINQIADYIITGTVEEVIPKMIKYYKKNSK